MNILLEAEKVYVPASLQVMGNADLARLAFAPQLASMGEVQPNKFDLTEYEKSVMPGLVCHFTNLKIRSVTPRYQLGRVFSFDVTPWQSPDPTFLFCAHMDMSMYHEVWARIMREQSSFWEFMDDYHRAMRVAIRSARGLTRDEVMFAVMEMLRFKNEAM